jgi:N-acetyl-anhydromuramyl-L-alanine amidase AmpD
LDSEAIVRLADWGHTIAAGRKIDTLIIHSSYNALGGDIYDLDKIINIYRDYEVAPHYIVARDGKIYQLVKEPDIAYHAGKSKMPDGRENVNDFSIGIEMVNSEEEGPSEKQYSALKKLIARIKTRREIKNILGHNDIAPGRKTDPWKFDWNKL